jgi:hypothetical protein
MWLSLVGIWFCGRYTLDVDLKALVTFDKLETSDKKVTALKVGLLTLIS